jgi:hypothetical protein
MIKDEYDALDLKAKAIATECYIDGFKDAINFLEFMTMRIDGGNMDQTFHQIKELFISALKSQLERYKQ